MITVRSTINLAHQSVPEVIPAVQGDTGRSILFSLADFTIPEGATARYFITKPSGLAVYNDATIDGNAVLVDLTAQSLAEYGDCPGQVRISVGDTVVTSFEFILHVEPFRGIDAVESTTETNIFDKAVEDAREAIAEAAEDAEEYISQALDTTLTIPDKAADAKATGDAISDSADAVIAQMRAEIANVYPTESAQGNPATFDDGAESIPVKDIKVSIVPNQDLHGYDKPWAGGAGKNLLPLTVAGIKAANTSGTWSGNVYSINGGTFTIITDADGNVTGINANGTFTATSSFIFINNSDMTTGFAKSVLGQTIVLNGCPSRTGNPYVQMFNTWGTTSVIYDNGSDIAQLSIPSTVSGFRCEIQMYAGTVSNVLFKPMIRLASVSDATFAPYSNECPITGMTEVEVERTSKNLLKMRTTSVSANGITIEPDNGYVNISGTTGASSYAYDLVDTPNAELTALFARGGKVTLSLNKGAYDSTTFNLTITYKYTESGEARYLLPNGTATLPVGSIFLRASLWIPANTTPKQLTGFAMQLEYGDVVTSFAPYSKQTITTDLDRTVYGGTLDVTSGVLTVDMVSVDLGTLTWFLQGSGTDGGHVFGSTGITRKAWSSGISSSMEVQNNGSWAGTLINTINMGHASIPIFVSSATITDPDEFKTAMNGVQLVYELATPQTYTLTPQELLSVLGTNHISTDAESVEVVYRQDIGLILKRMSDSLLPYLPLTRDGIYDLKAEVTGGEKSLYWWTQAISMMSSARPMQTPIADDEPLEEEEELEEEPEEEEMTPEEDEED